MKLNNVLITGSSGFIGQRLVKAIDANIRVLSREKYLNFDTVICDFEKDSIPKYALEGIDIVFHLAGIAHDTNTENKLNNVYQKVNIDSSFELADLAIKSGVKVFVFISSVKAGGISDLGKCLNEKNQTEPDNIYGRSKREAELKLLKLAKNTRMHLSIIRPALVYGPNVKGNLKLMLDAINKGWFPPLPKTNNKRSMIHVDDLVKAILLVSKDNRANGEIFIATDGIPHSSSEIYEAMCYASGKKIATLRVPRFLFKIISKLSPKYENKIKKLLGNEYYSSNKLEELGFIPTRTLKEINETYF